MKKLLPIFLCLIVLFSCSDSDEETDIIVGTWNLFSINGNEVIDCEKESFVTFFSDNTATGEDYQLTINNTCEEVGTSEIVQWINEGNNTYVIRPNTNPLTWNIVFSDNNNTLNITNQGVIYKR